MGSHLNLKSAGRRNWGYLSSISSDCSIPFFPVKSVDVNPRIEVPDDVHDEGLKLWDCALIAQFVGRIPNFSAFQKSVNLM